MWTQLSTAQNREKRNFDKNLRQEQAFKVGVYVILIAVT